MSVILQVWYSLERIILLLRVNNFNKKLKAVLSMWNVKACVHGSGMYIKSIGLFSTGVLNIGLVDVRDQSSCQWVMQPHWPAPERRVRNIEKYKQQGVICLQLFAYASILKKRHKPSCQKGVMHSIELDTSKLN